MPEPSQQPSQAVLRIFDGEYLIDDRHSGREQPADNTCRPVLDPVDACGHEFEPFNIEHRDATINTLPTAPLTLFQLFVPSSLVNKWVEYTNDAPISSPAGPSKKRSRKHTWTPVTADKVYIWLAIVIYLGIHPEKSIASNWATRQSGQQRPTHAIIKFMTYDRFQQVQQRLRIHPHTTSPITAFARCDEWSPHIQGTSLSIYQPGTSIAVDEAIIGFKGRSKQKTTIPSKPTQTGFKVWVVAQKGYFCSGFGITQRLDLALPPAVTGKERELPNKTAQCISTRLKVSLLP